MRETSHRHNHAAENLSAARDQSFENFRHPISPGVSSVRIEVSGYELRVFGPILLLGSPEGLAVRLPSLSLQL